MPSFNPNDYETVESRLERFWGDNPTGRVLTSIAYRDGDTIAFRAELYREEVDERPDATGYAEETKGQGNVNRTSHVENCETSAIGRALANMGYTTKGKRPSREEMRKASDPSPEPSRAATKPAPMNPNDYAKLNESAKKAGLKGKEGRDLWAAICEMFPADGSASDEALTYGLAQIEAMG